MTGTHFSNSVDEVLRRMLAARFSWTKLILLSRFWRFGAYEWYKLMSKIRERAMAVDQMRVYSGRGVVVECMKRSER